MKEYSFSAKQLENSLANIKGKGITEITVNDSAITTERAVFLRLLGKIRVLCPDVHFSFYLSIENIDLAVIKALAEIYSSVTIALPQNAVSDSLLRKTFNKKTNLLNEYGIVFGFSIASKFVSFKAFKSLLDFSFSMYPNHIEIDTSSLEASATLSTVDIKKIKQIAFATETFYTYGRAVPWFLTALEPLKIKPTQFFSDFAEWQLCNNCDSSTNFVPSQLSHQEIEKMQLLFLLLKYEEKNIKQYYTALTDFVKIQGAFARAACEGEHSILDLSYHPEDILSSQIYDIAFFCDNTCMEYTQIRVFPGDEEVQYEIL